MCRLRKKLQIAFWGLISLLAACGSAKTELPESKEIRETDVKERNVTEPDTAMEKSLLTGKEASGDAPTENINKPAKSLPVLLNSLVTGVTASSHVSNHPPEHVLDGMNETAWNARGDAPGKEWLQFRFEKPVDISTIVMSTGWEKMSRKNQSKISGNFSSDSSRFRQVCGGTPA